MIIQAAVICSNLKTLQILLKNCLQFLTTSISATTDAMALNFFQTLSNYKKAKSANLL